MDIKEKLKLSIYTVITVAFVILFTVGIDYSDKKNQFDNLSSIPRIGQKLWTYNMNEHNWYNYSKHDDEESKEIIILQVQLKPEYEGITSYHLITGNNQVPREDVMIGEGSLEFLVGKKLYSYFPRTFETYEIVFNGVKFMPKKVSEEETLNIFKEYEIIKISDLKKGNFNLKYSKLHNKFLVLNDIGDKFYKYYIIPNDSSKMQIGEYSNQFKVNGDVQIKLQRLEGCSNAYPCYEINLTK